MKKSISIAIILLFTLIAVTSLSACTQYMPTRLSEQYGDLSRGATYISSDGKETDDLSHTSGKGEGFFNVRLSGTYTFNSVFIPVKGDDITIEISYTTPSGDKATVYTGESGYCCFPAITTDNIDIKVITDSRWHANDMQIYNMKYSDKKVTVFVNAEDLLSGLVTPDYFDCASTVVLRSNLHYNSLPDVAGKAVFTEEGEEYFANAVNTLKTLIAASASPSASVTVQADPVFTPEHDALDDTAHIRFTALHTYTYYTAQGLASLLDRYGLQGLHLDFPESRVEGSTLYYLSKFAVEWRNITSANLSVSFMTDSSLYRSGKLNDLFNNFFRDGSNAIPCLSQIMLVADEDIFDSQDAFYKAVYEITDKIKTFGYTSKFAFVLPCADENTSLTSYASKILYLKDNSLAPVVNMNSYGAAALSDAYRNR